MRALWAALAVLEYVPDHAIPFADELLNALPRRGLNPELPARFNIHLCARRSPRGRADRQDRACGIVHGRFIKKSIESRREVRELLRIVRELIDDAG
jgi:hypothetical protein